MKEASSVKRSFMTHTAIQYNGILQTKDLLAHYKKLAETRQEISALTSNAIFLYAANDYQISFFRDEEKNVLVVASNGLSSAEFDLPDGLWKVVGSGEVLENSTKIPPLRAIVLERVP
jgi:hypothetical protein